MNTNEDFMSSVMNESLIKNKCRKDDEEYKSLVGKAIDYLQTGERKN